MSPVGKPHWPMTHQIWFGKSSAINPPISFALITLLIIYSEKKWSLRLDLATVTFSDKEAVINHRCAIQEASNVLTWIGERNHGAWLIISPGRQCEPCSRTYWGHSVAHPSGWECSKPAIPPWLPWWSTEIRIIDYLRQNVWKWATWKCTNNMRPNGVVWTLFKGLSGSLI